MAELVLLGNGLEGGRQQQRLLLCCLAGRARELPLVPYVKNLLPEELVNTQTSDKNGCD